MNIAFYMAATIAIIATLMVVTRLNAVHALIYLVISLLSVSVIFYLVGATFAAALEVIIYAGAIMVLFIFVVMMLHLGEKSVRLERQWLKPSMWIGPSLLALILIVEMLYLILNEGTLSSHASIVDAKQVGISLYGPYLICVELAAILLMAGIVGAYHLGKEKVAVRHRFLQNEDNDD